MLRHILDQRTGGARLFVPRRPNEQLQKYWSQINSLLRQPVVHAPSVRLFFFGGNDSRGFELLQTVRQNVRSDPFARFLELLERPEATNHQVTNDQQRPAVSKDLERYTHRATRPAF